MAGCSKTVDVRPLMLLLREIAINCFDDSHVETIAICSTSTFST
jgi:hypothetical protein